MARAVVSIIGRPNVGKSTLFNRLVGGRVSITEDTPGVTRDRLYREVEWQNKYFLLMDTGGLEVNTEDIIAKNIAFQVDIALESSDLVLFLVDGRSGLTPMDLEVAERIRKSGRRCIVVINKIDNPKIPDTAYEFYELGMDDYILISAEQSRGLGDLLDMIFEYLPKDRNIGEEIDATPIAIIGKPNVGKSSLVNLLLGEERMIVTDIPGTTRDSIDSYYERDGEKYLLTDTAGLRRKRSVNEFLERLTVLRTFDAVDRSELCLFLIDASEGPTEQDTKIAGYAHNEHKASVIVVNKWDLVERQTNTQRDYERKIRNALSFNHYAPVVFVSVKENHNMDRLFQTVKEVNANYSFRIATGLLNQLLRDAMAMNPPPSDKGVRLKIFYLSQVGTRPPKFVFYVNDKDLFHFSYQRYLENQLRKQFNFTGVPLFFEIRERRGE